MNYVEYLDTVMKSGTDNFWRTAKAIPEDKLDWQPAPDARTARALIAEVADITGATADMIKARSAENLDMPSKDKKSVEEMEQTHRANVEKFMAVVREFPEADLSQTLDLPWGKMSFLDMIDYVYWNMMYHNGQLNYIQTLYGDTEFR